MILTYLKIGGVVVLLAAIAGGIWYVQDLRLEAADAEAQIVSAQATANEANAAHAADLETIAQLQADKAASDAAIATAASQAAQTQQTVTQVETKVKYVQLPADCHLTARDSAVLGGLRDILAAPAAAGGNAGGAAGAAVRAPGGHSAAGAAGQPHQPG